MVVREIPLEDYDFSGRINLHISPTFLQWLYNITIFVFGIIQIHEKEYIKGDKQVFNLGRDSPWPDIWTEDFAESRDSLQIAVQNFYTIFGRLLHLKPGYSKSLVLQIKHPTYYLSKRFLG